VDLERGPLLLAFAREVEFNRSNQIIFNMSFPVLCLGKFSA
jgi:hypothetical protein